MGEFPRIYEILASVNLFDCGEEFGPGVLDEMIGVERIYKPASSFCESDFALRATRTSVGRNSRSLNV